MASVLLALLPTLGPDRLAAQQALLVNGTAGVSFDINDRDPVGGTGFAFLGGVGVRLRRVTIGGEFGQYALGGDRKARLYGAFVRVPAMSGRRVEPYLLLGLGVYRYSPATGSRSHAVGGSVGPGLAFTIARSRARVLFESRFHSALDRIGTIAGEEFVTVAAGLEFAW